MPATFLTAAWRKLVIANYAVDPALLMPMLPAYTELDIWNGKCYVSLLGFRFVNTKVKGIPVPFHTQFEEVNLRFYVRHRESAAWKRGAVFIKEIVPKPAITFFANSLFGEKYVTMPMQHEWHISDKEMEIAYSWKHGGTWDEVRFRTSSTPHELAVGSKEEFITEHYWGYTRMNKSVTQEYQVEHPRWMMYPVIDYKINVRFGLLYGQAFEELGSRPPDSVMMAEGSNVLVTHGRKIRGKENIA